ncbi:MAG TPA: pitrilysin family protein, partial [Limnochordales bacterium]
RMYEDDPGRNLFVQLMQALYHVHPVRLEIGGTVDSIRRIEVDTLYLCHRSFYRPDNAVLAIVGGVDPERALAEARQALARHGPAPDGAVVQRLYPEEPVPARQARVERCLAVSRPRLLLGIKDVPAVRSGQELVRRSVAINLALQAAFGTASDHFREMYEAGLIDDGFSARYLIDTRYAHTLVGGETDRPDEVEQRLREILSRLADEGIGGEDFERLRRRELGEFIASLDHPEWVANSLVTLHFQGAWPGDYLEALTSITREEVDAAVREHVAPERIAVSLVLPGGGIDPAGGFSPAARVEREPGA